MQFRDNWIFILRKKWFSAEEFSWKPRNEYRFIYSVFYVLESFPRVIHLVKNTCDWLMFLLEKLKYHKMLIAHFNNFWFSSFRDKNVLNAENCCAFDVGVWMSWPGEVFIIFVDIDVSNFRHFCPWILHVISAHNGNEPN